jgi:hypothetical protein
MEAACERLQTLVANATLELREGADDYCRLLTQLNLLQRSLGANELPVEVLRSVLRAFPAKLRPTRAGAPAGRGLKETRKLWAEVNRIVQSRQESQPTEKGTQSTGQR